MKGKHVAVVLGLIVLALLVGLFAKPYIRPDHSNAPPGFYLDGSSSSSADYTQPAVEPSSSSESSAPASTKTVTLVDQSFEGTVDTKGIERLRAMGTVKLTGHVQNATLHVTLSRNGVNDGVAGVFVYSADLDERGIIRTDTEWLRFKGLDSVWKGTCGMRNLGGSSKLLSGKSESVEGHYSLTHVPFTNGDDGCDTSVADYDLQSRLNDKGIVIGFLPSDAGYHVKATLEYDGELTVTPL